MNFKKWVEMTLHVPPTPNNLPFQYNGRNLRVGGAPVDKSPWGGKMHILMENFLFPALSEF
jgi:hypothetical protein